MGIFLKWRGDRLSPQWWGFWQADGRRHEVSVCKWRGTPPPKGAGKHAKGDEEFEKSRWEAEQEFKKMTSEERSEADRTVLVAKIHAARYGGRVERVKISDLWARWEALPHKAGEERRRRVCSILNRFERFMRANYPRITEAGALTAEHFKAFLDDVDKWGIAGKKKDEASGKRSKNARTIPAEDRGGVSARTWNDVLFTLRSVLGKVDGQGTGFRDYLEKLPFRDETTIHRRPFTEAELEAIYSAAAEIDPELRPVIVAAACTALRRGDVAQLRWEDVDMAGGFCTVKTAKTGETVEIPIFPPFMAVLREAKKKRRDGVPYVFPKIALAYRADRNSLDRRLKKVLAAAGFVRPEKVKAGGKYPAPPSPADAVAAVDAGMRGARWSEARRKKGLAILQRHLSGEDGRTIASALGVARGAVSTYLHDMEMLGQIALVSPPKAETPARPILAAFRDGEQRRNRGSLVGWHGFRTSFCSLALAAGIPMELLVRITGHRTVAIVEKYYNQAKREQTRRAFSAAMSKAIAGPAEATNNASSEELVAVPADVAKLAEMLAGASPEQLKKVEKMLKKGAGK